MDASHYRKIDVQSPADLFYLHANATMLAHQKVDLHLPPSASGSDPDPLRERVKELVDNFITRTFEMATASISVNGLDAPPSISSAADAQAQSQARETIEYEPYDSRLADRVTALYAQLESLTTTVAQLRRDAPGRAAKAYADLLKKAVNEDDEVDEDTDPDLSERDSEIGPGADVCAYTSDGVQRSHQQTRHDWKLEIPLGTDNEISRWREGDMALNYEAALRSLLKLQGDGAVTLDAGEPDGHALASTVGKAERAVKAVEVIENM